MSGGAFDSGIPALLMQAAQSAAQADGLASARGSISNTLIQQHEQMQRKAIPPPPSSGGGKKKGPPLRRGKWTQEEEAYANRLIQEFKAGLLPLTDGTTLRTFLSKLLNCDPMRISKKFVGSNCIGKQVFRRRTADLNRLTPEQIQKSRAELSELERRFLDRVAQTNRVKSSGVGGSGAPAANSAGPSLSGVGTEGIKREDNDNTTPPSPPWLQTPLGYKQGSGAAMAAANLGGGESSSRAAAAGRALLQGLNPGSLRGRNGSGLTSSGSAGVLAMAELQRRASQQSLLQKLGGQSAQNLLAALNSSSGGNSSMGSLARSTSAARLGLGGSNSINNLMLKTGFSRDELTQLAKDRGLSSASLSNMIERKNSFDALMSLDFQSLQSIDNLANLIQSGASSNQAPASGMKNWSAGDAGSSKNSLAGLAGVNGSTGSLSQVARRLASSGQMESLLRSLSNNNVRSTHGGAGGQSSTSNLQTLLQNVQGGIGSSSMSSLLGNSGNTASASSLANLLRENSSTGLTALRMQDGLNNRNSSVEDFLSLVAAGDIPHQDPSLLNVPLMRHQQKNSGESSNNLGAAAVLAQQRLLAQATGNPSLANAIASRSFGNLRNLSGNLGRSESAAALLSRAGDGQGGSSSLSLKRKLLELEGGHDLGSASKR